MIYTQILGALHLCNVENLPGVVGKVPLHMPSGAPDRHFKRLNFVAPREVIGREWRDHAVPPTAHKRSPWNRPALSEFLVTAGHVQRAAQAAHNPLADVFTEV